MFVPLGIDGITRRRPYATAGIVIANWAVAFLLGFLEPFFKVFKAGDISFLHSLTLTYGEWNPLTWVTSAFVHRDIAHLAFNMIFLLTAGMIVETLIGWRRFVPLFLAVVLLQGMAEEALFAAGNGSYGASGAVYALILIAALWAPATRVRCVYMVLPYAGTAEVSVKGLALWCFGWQIAYATFTPYALSSEMLHVIGATIGLGAGLLFLKRGWVDTEGEDWLARWRARSRASRELYETTDARPVPPKPLVTRDELVDLGLLLGGAACIAFGVFLSLFVMDFREPETRTASAFVGFGALALIGVGFTVLRYRHLR